VDSSVEIQQDCVKRSVFSLLLNVAKDSGSTGKSLTSFTEFQISGAAWLNALGENLARLVSTTTKLSTDNY